MSATTGDFPYDYIINNKHYNPALKTLSQCVNSGTTHTRYPRHYGNGLGPDEVAMTDVATSFPSSFRSRDACFKGVVPSIQIHAGSVLLVDSINA